MTGCERPPRIHNPAEKQNTHRRLRRQASREFSCGTNEQSNNPTRHDPSHATEPRHATEHKIHRRKTTRRRTFRYGGCCPGAHPQHPQLHRQGKGGRAGVHRALRGEGHSQEPEHVRSEQLQRGSKRRCPPLPPVPVRVAAMCESTSARLSQAWVHERRAG